jgi:predicted RNase H-like nuclease (RuvC/YqgF family)
MSETRALRERLEELQAELRRAKEHLEKLRAHQAREREPLRQELEAERRELAELRVRLQKAESPEGHPGTGTALPELASVEGPEGATTALVALGVRPRWRPRCQRWRGC